MKYQRRKYPDYPSSLLVITKIAMLTCLLYTSVVLSTCIFQNILFYDTIPTLKSHYLREAKAYSLLVAHAHSKLAATVLSTTFTLVPSWWPTSVWNILNLVEEKKRGIMENYMILLKTSAQCNTHHFYSTTTDISKSMALVWLSWGEEGNITIETFNNCER